MTEPAVTRSTEARLGRLEKTAESLTTMVNEIKIKFQRTNERLSAFDSKLDAVMAEIRAALGMAPMLMPTFDGSDAITWLTRAEQYFLITNTPPETRLQVAMSAVAGPALPWLQLLIRRLPTLSWDRFTQELMKRFGDNATLHIALELHPRKTVATVADDEQVVPKLLVEEDHSEFNTVDEPVLEGFDEVVTTKKKREVAPLGFGSESPHELATLPPNSTSHYEIEFVSFAKEKAFWDMSNAENTTTAGTKETDGLVLFKDKECVRVSKNHDGLPGLIDYAGTIASHNRNCQRRCLLWTHLFCWHMCTIAIWFRATGSKSNRYWFSGRGMRWKKRRGWTLKTCEGSFDFFLRLVGKAFSRVRQLIRHQCGGSAHVAIVIRGQPQYRMWIRAAGTIVEQHNITWKVKEVGQWLCTTCGSCGMHAEVIA